MARFSGFGGIWDEVTRAQDEVARLVGRFGIPGVAPHAAGTGPLVNVWEDDNVFHAEADLPGIDPAKLEITVTEGNQLTIAGERTPPEVKGAAWVRQERPFGRFTRVVGLPVMVDPDRVEARYENGVLRLTLPKSEAAKPRKISVQGG